MTDDQPETHDQPDTAARDAAGTTGRKVAAFDFDGTISQRDTLLGFLVKVGGRTTVAKALLANSMRLARGLQSSAARNTAKEQVLGRVLRGRSDEELVAAGRAYAREVAHSFRPETLAAIRHHRADGHETVIVSASLVYYLRPIATALGMSDVIGVEMATDANGRLTGALARPNVRGEQKSIRLREWLDSSAPDVAADVDVATDVDVELWAYGDSSGDEALLAMADHPRWMGRRAKRR